jgi:Spy/CpxP family protein refolding chaperone
MALLAASLAPGASAANDAAPPAEHPARRMWAELGLTAEQEAKFREINSRYAPVRREHARRMDELKAKINQEVMKERPSRSLLAQYAGQMGEAQKKMNIASVDHLLSVKAVLTPEQFKLFADRASISGSGEIGGRSRGARGGNEADEE